MKNVGIIAISILVLMSGCCASSGTMSDAKKVIEGSNGLEAIAFCYKRHEYLVFQKGPLSMYKGPSISAVKTGFPCTSDEYKE